MTSSAVQEEDCISESNSSLNLGKDWRYNSNALD